MSLAFGCWQPTHHWKRGQNSAQLEHNVLRGDKSATSTRKQKGRQDRRKLTIQDASSWRMKYIGFFFSPLRGKKSLHVSMETLWDWKFNFKPLEISAISKNRRHTQCFIPAILSGLLENITGMKENCLPFERVCLKEGSLQGPSHQQYWDRISRPSYLVVDTQRGVWAHSSR